MNVIILIIFGSKITINVMPANYFTLPLETNKLITNEVFNKSDLKQSIANHIHLINTTYFGECSFDETFGCSIWDVDFDNLSNVNKIKDTISKSLINSLKKHEKRLGKVSVNIKIKQEEISSTRKSLIIKKKITIKVKGNVMKTNENFVYEEQFFIGPLSY